MGTWANYRKRLPVKIEDLNTEYCTHIMYGFAALNATNYTIKAFDPYLDYDLSKSTMNQK
jgi:GH18 family chitinase